MVHAVFLPDIRSGWNVGAFFRTADSLGISQIFLSGLTPKPPHKEISKTALDADIFVPWSYFSDSIECAKELKKRGYSLVAMELTENAISLEKFEFPKNACLVMGNEITGVSREMLELCDSVVFIPMQGGKQSMNVSIAGSLGMWEMVKSIKI
jgi:tRNA G18 (ribose-2'-O)-methylase SpoU